MIPIVDCRGDVDNVGVEILNAIESVGFVYLKNCGIEYADVEEVSRIAGQFWQFPPEFKARYARAKDYENEGNSGYVAPGVEMLNPGSKAEIREAYNVTPKDNCHLAFPDDILPDLRPKLLSLFHQCHSLSLKIMRQLAIQLGFEVLNADFFTDNHQGIGTGANATTLRLLHYPPLPDDLPDGAVRCGAHTDYGTVTLLFQDDVGGLEVSRRDGVFVPAVPEQKCVLVNTGDLLQRWTSDRLLAVKHRVLVPSDRRLWTSERQSMAFFVHPDDECVVTPIDGSGRYSPISAGQHLKNMFSKTY